jgi:hypothetical protein
VGGREWGGGEEGDTEIPDEFRKITTRYLLISLAKIAEKRMNIYLALLLIVISTSMALL